MAFALLQPTRHDVYPFIDPTQNLRTAAAGKTVLVTGAGTGIGRGIGESFALAGASSLILVARRAEKLEETRASIDELTPDCRVTVASGVDVADRASIEQLFKSLAHDVPDVIVSNAASSSSASIADSDPGLWWQGMEVNVRGPYLIARSYIHAARAAGKTGGRIINVSSNNAWRYIPGLSSYAASKAALNTLTEYIDNECLTDGSGIRSVAMHPGGVPTDMARLAGIPENLMRLMIDQPALPGATAVYLSTQRADFLMGRFVSSTWDMEQLEGVKERVLEEDLLRSRVVGVA
ncbi:hypothetical protein LTR53_008127 [Teratosphaeriaceae sp. CCFEE 6253]|nr:hypothetical protein LTR53_008127 [Teratosphaeriaceae sp. CCFEE 6253]